MFKDTGYIPGGGMLSPNRDIFYLNLPKNASTYLTNILKYNNWSHWNIIQEPVNVQSSLVVLRDPVERWISGFGTYAALRLFGYGYGSDHFIQDYTDLTERLIFDQIIFDDHTDFQLNYAKQVIDYNPVYFRCNRTLLQQINSYLGYDLNTDTATDDNKSESNYDTAQITQFIQKRIIDKPDLKSKIVLAYFEDYQFIRNIDFYNDPR